LQGPTIVEVQLRLTQVNEIDQKRGTATVNGYFRSWWNDPGLKFDYPNFFCPDILHLHGDDASALWQPDLYFDNLVEKIGAAGFPSSLSVDCTGRVFRSEQVRLQVKFPMTLGRFPYDDHVVEIIVASYSLTNSDLRIVPGGGVLGDGASGIGISAPQIPSVFWSFPNDLAADPSQGFETPGVVETTDGREFVALQIPISRESKFYIDQVIIPCQLFLDLSYMQFFVPASAVPARAALAVIPVLIMRTMFDSVYQSLPEGSQ